MQIMRVVKIAEGLHLAMYSSLLVELSLGDQLSIIAHLLTLQKLNMLQHQMLARKQYCLVGELGIHEVPILHCDSQSAIALAKNSVFHSKSKHIRVHYHLIRDIMADKRLQLVKIHTDDNPVDALTKSLATKRFAHCIELMGVG
ncbi:hypothetical protein L7F22_054510 [Adiantum nelumboides]|nr:hypothetical protein [Adiantum nelumboides]